jgi:hypothetical protein
MSDTPGSDTGSPDTGTKSKKNLYIGLAIAVPLVVLVGLGIGIAYALWPKSCIKQCGNRCNVDDGCKGQCTCNPGRNCVNNNCVDAGTGTGTGTPTTTSTRSGNKKPHGSGSSSSTGTSTSSGKSTNKSIIITGTNGKSVTYTDPKEIKTLLYGKGDYQSTTGCWSLDTNDNWKAALKDGSYCRVKSITLPANIQAKTYTTTGKWDNLCSDTFIEDIPAGSTDYLLKSGGTPACGFLFSEVTPS